MRLERYHTWVGRGLLLGLILALVACGFQLRTETPWQNQWQRAYITQDGARELQPVFQRVLTEKGVTLVGRDEADVVIELTNEKTTRTSLAIDATGKISEYSLGYQVKCQVRDGAGKIIMPLREFSASRSYAFHPAQALAHELQEQQMYQAMRKQVVAEILQQLNTLTTQPAGAQQP